MLAQYYPDEQKIVIFSDVNYEKILEIPSSEKKYYGFPPFKKWHKTSWGYEIEFKFEVNQEIDNK